MRWLPDDDGHSDDQSVRGDDLPDNDPHSLTALGPVRGPNDAEGVDGTDGIDGPNSEYAHGADGRADRTWEQELPRWLATLDSGRTRREYEKAVGYFFRTPGVPSALAALTFDLLLAYRGTLALRAERQSSAPTRKGATMPSAARRLATSSIPPLPSASGSDDGDLHAEADHAGAMDAGDAIPVSSRLAPATVNIRLTALRQFLAHCGLWGHLPDLPPDRVRAALRRLRIERRRPYQILAEPEWADFLRAAEAPRQLPPGQHVRTHPSHREPTVTPAVNDAAGDPPIDGQSTPPDAPLGGAHWGVPRAMRPRRHADQPAPLASAPSARDPGKPTTDAQPRRTRSGLTGAYTAQRDHALLALALATGLRAIELCALDLGDIAREWNAGVEEWWLILPDAKTKGQHGGRTLPLASALVTTLLEYARATGRSFARTADRATPLFLSRRLSNMSGTVPTTPNDARHDLAQRRLTPSQVRRIVDRVETQWLAAQEGDISPRPVTPAGAETRAISPHALRHSTAIALLEGNERTSRAPASVEHVRGWLGHFDIRTTQGYLAHLDARRHRRPFTLQPVEDRTAPAQPDAANSAPPEPDDAIGE